jgi:hypothetical protein
MSVVAEAAVEALVVVDYPRKAGRILQTRRHRRQGKTNTAMEAKPSACQQP